VSKFGNINRDKYLEHPAPSETKPYELLAHH